MAKARRYNRKSEYEDQYEDPSLSRLERMALNPDFWEKMAEDELYYKLREMGNPDSAIQKYQKNRFFQSLLFAGLGLIIGIVMNNMLVVGGGAVLGIFMYISRLSSVRKMHNQWKFEREMAFSRFVRLLIPYLKQSGGNVSLYTTFNKMLGRLDDEDDRESLYMLMGEIGDRPGDIQPFYDFAERSSGSDMAYLIMSTVFDFQESTTDTTVIDELGQMASEQMMDAIDEIIAFKIRRFGMFPTKVVMSSFILVVGLAVGIVIDAVSQFDFSGMGM